MTYHRSLICFALALVPTLLTPTTPVRADETFAPVAVISLPDGQKIQSFDISFVDPAIGIYVLGDRTNKAVDVIDTTTNTVLTQLVSGFAGATSNNDTSGPDGVMTVGHREVWAGDGISTVKVINLFSQVVTHTISTGGVNRADELCLDPRHHLVMVANNADSPPFASIISTTTYAVVKRSSLTGPLARRTRTMAPSNASGIIAPAILYLHPGNRRSADRHRRRGGDRPRTLAVETTFIVPLASCEAPQGMTIGPDHQILLGCNGSAGANHPTAVIDDRNGHVIKTLANKSGSDEVWYNEGDGHYFLARSSSVGTNQLLGIVDPTRPASGTTISPAATSRRMRTL